MARRWVFLLSPFQLCGTGFLGSFRTLGRWCGKTLCVAIVFAHALSAASGKFSSKNCRKNVSMIAWACDLLIQFIQTCERTESKSHPHELLPI